MQRTRDELQAGLLAAPPPSAAQEGGGICRLWHYMYPALAAVMATAGVIAFVNLWSPSKSRVDTPGPPWGCTTSQPICSRMNSSQCSSQSAACSEHWTNGSCSAACATAPPSPACRSDEGGPWSLQSFARCTNRTFYGGTCVGECCCRCSATAYAYNPTPELMQWRGYNYSTRVVHGAEATSAGLNYSAAENNRLVGVAWPSNNRKMPPNGWPIVLYFAPQLGSGQPEMLRNPAQCNNRTTWPFSSARTLACGVNFTAVDFRECVFKTDSQHNSSNGWRYEAGGGTFKRIPWRAGEYASDYTSGRLWRRLLQEGFAVVYPQVLGAQQVQSRRDKCTNWHAFVPGLNTTTPAQDCQWPGPDAAFLGALYDVMADGEWGAKLDLRRQSIVGYSSGAFFVSRLLAEAPGLKTPKHRPFPTVAAAVMVCGASYDTYRFYDGGTKYLFARHGAPNASFFPNASFRRWPSLRHPPTLFAQPMADDYVPYPVAKYYYSQLRKNNITSDFLTVNKASTIQSSDPWMAKLPPVSALTVPWTHMFFAGMIEPTTAFIVDNHVK